MKLKILVSVATLVALTSQPLAAVTPRTTTAAQHFVCNAGYTLEKCREDLAVLRRALAKYPLGELGEWTWLLVGSEDWKSILVPRGLDPNSPAFTYYDQHETFIEEALVAEVPGRRGKLLIDWGMTIPDLLDLAIAHELGHALCNERDEAKANRVARLLQSQQPFTCELKLASKGRSKETRQGR